MARFRAWREWRGKRPGAVYRKVRVRTRELTHPALYDYADNAGTDMARALYTLRKEPTSRVALLEAYRQQEMLWALMDEIRDRQKAML